MSEQTTGERVFEAYLRSRGIDDFQHEKPFTGKNKRPDYSVLFGGVELLFEVKDFDFTQGPDWSGFWNPYPSLREKIDQARKKFKEFKSYPCSLVLFDNQGLALLDDPSTVFGAMHGDLTFAFLIDPGTGSAIPNTSGSFFANGGRMTQPNLRRPQNTTINALVAMRKISIGQARLTAHAFSFGDAWREHLRDAVNFDKDQVELGAIVYENKDAARPLPREFFNGPSDVRWSIENGTPTCIHAGDVVREFEILGRASPSSG